MGPALAHPHRDAYSRLQFPGAAVPTTPMRSQTVILTHEHADFDALASLLGGVLLYPQALPVLPRKLKRNVQAFLSLYRNQFPFIEPRHLPRCSVELAIVVDTRSFNSVKGIGEDTRHLVIDHHSAAEPLPSGWEDWQESLGPHTTGANVTLLVERLMQQNRKLSRFRPLCWRWAFTKIPAASCTPPLRIATFAAPPGWSSRARAWT